MGGIQRCLERNGHEVEWSKFVVGQKAQDQLLATTAMDAGQVLVTHDGDFQRIQRYLSDKYLQRFPTLSRLMFQCSQAISVQRLEVLMPMVEFEFEHARFNDRQFMMHIQERRIIIYR
jgi:hypothetical protein